jgi:transcriptional regulator with XRE-family HTH domain
MSIRESPAARGARRGREAHHAFVQEITQARLSLGKSQTAVAREAGLDRSAWSLCESGKRTALTWELAGRMAAAVGLDLSVRLYPADSVLRDAGQVRLLDDGQAELGTGWRWRPEQRVRAGSGVRAWDSAGTHASGLEMRMEAEVRFRDGQATLRRIEAKRVADGSPRVILLIRDSKANRLAVREAAMQLRSAFPVSAREALPLLRAGIDPGGDVRLMVGYRSGARPQETPRSS